MDHAHIIEKYQESKVDPHAPDSSDTESLLELLESLEQDDDLEHLREQRMAELRNEFKRIDRAIDVHGDSTGSVHYTSDEKELMNAVAKADVALVHFYQASFPRCQAMNDLLALVAEKHLPISIMAIQAADAPFLVTKLRVKVLPLLIVYRKGQELSRIVGFEGIGGTEKAASLQTMEAFLNKCGVINRTTMNAKSVRDKKASVDSDESDYD